MNRADEVALAQRIADGHNTAEATFDRLFRPKVETFVRKRGVPRRDCADVAQMVLTDALRQLRLDKFRGDAALSTWMHRIMVGKVIDYQRKQRQFDTISLEDVSTSHSSLVAFSDRDVVLAVQQALSRVSTEDEFLLRVYYQQGWTLEEIGPMVGLHKSAVAERLKAACERFRVAIRDGGKNPDPKRLKD